MLTVTTAAKKLPLSQDRVRKLLQSGRIRGAQKFGSVWIVPDDVVIDPPLKVQHRLKKQKRR
jgi:excisionase family DNA binding protein